MCSKPSIHKNRQLLVACSLAIYIFIAAVRTGAQVAPGATSPTFEVATVKPTKPGTMSASTGMRNGVYVLTNRSVKEIVEFAYGNVSGGPGWIGSAHYDLAGKLSDADRARLDKLSDAEQFRVVKLMLQSLLVDRFKLKVSHYTEEEDGYVLVATKKGAKLPVASSTPAPLAKDDQHDEAHWVNIVLKSASVENLAQELSWKVGKTVVDETKLTGKYDVTLHVEKPSDPSAEGYDDMVHARIASALASQLGLELKSKTIKKAAVKIEQIERPAEN